MTTVWTFCHLDSYSWHFSLHVTVKKAQSEDRGLNFGFIPELAGGFRHTTFPLIFLLYQLGIMQSILLNSRSAGAVVSLSVKVTQKC